MLITQKEILTKYAESVQALSNDKIKTADIVATITTSSKKIKNLEDIQQIFRKYTNQLIISKEHQELGDALTNGLTEVLSQLFFNYTYPGLKMKCQHSIYAESCVVDILVDVIGKQECIILLLAQPGVFDKYLRNISYKKTNLLNYLQQRLATITSHSLATSQISKSTAIIDCCEAISDCHDNLTFSKGYAYEKK